MMCILTALLKHAVKHDSGVHFLGHEGANASKNYDSAFVLGLIFVAELEVRLSSRSSKEFIDKRKGAGEQGGEP